VNALDGVKDQLYKLEKTIQHKDEEIDRLQVEIDLQAEKSQTFTQTHKENIELKESLKLSESELKRVTEEKKYALDELLKQTVKGKRKFNPAAEVNSNNPLPESNVRMVISFRIYIYSSGKVKSQRK